MAHALPDPRTKLRAAPMVRLPRLAWIAIGVAILIPIVVLGVTILFIGLATGLIVLAAILVAYGILSLAWKIMHRPRLTRGGGNQQIVVRSRVIDPPRS